MGVCAARPGARAAARDTPDRDSDPHRGPTHSAAAAAVRPPARARAVRAAPVRLQRSSTEKGSYLARIEWTTRREGDAFHCARVVRRSGTAPRHAGLRARAAALRVRIRHRMDILCHHDPHLQDGSPIHRNLLARTVPCGPGAGASCGVLGRGAWGARPRTFRLSC